MSDRRGCRINYGESEIETSLSNQTYVFRWRIKEFPDWPDSFKVTSHEFKPANDIILYATFERFIDTSKAKKCYLKVNSKEKNSFEIEAQLSFMNTSGKVYYETGPSKAACNDQNGTLCSYKIYDNTMEKYSKSASDKIVIFEYTMRFKGLSTENVNRYRLETSKDSLSAVIEDIRAMYVDTLCTDFSIRQENSVVRVHKFVLCARSPVFAQMLKSPMEEKEKDAIEINDIELSILKTFVKFLYTGHIPADLDFDSLSKLYYAADKYDVPTLRKACAEALLDKLDAENSCRVLSLANRHSDVQFVDAVLVYMRCHFDEVMETESWFEFATGEPELTNKVMRLRVQKSKQSTSN